MAELWYYLLSIVGIVVFVIGIIVLIEIRHARRRGSLKQQSFGSPSSFEVESKTRMMSSLEKREITLRRERIMDGGTLPELSELIIYSPTKNEKIETAEVDVRGKAAIKSIIWINNYAAFVDVDGSFIGNVPLYRGKNSLEVVAIGPYGKTLKTNLIVQCSSKEANISQSSIKSDTVLPSNNIESISRRTPTSPKNILEEEKIDNLSKTTKSKLLDTAVVPESEIDPSVLAALKGEPISELPPETAEEINLESIEPEISITEAEEKSQVSEIELPQPELPEIPPPPQNVVEPTPPPPKPKLKTKQTAIDISEKITDEAVKKQKGKEFPLDKMLPLVSKEKDSKKQPEAKIVEQPSIEMKSLLNDLKGSHELIVQTNRQKLNDSRLTEILQHSAFFKKKNGQLIQIFKIEKRVEKVGTKWYSTFGLANITDIEIDRVEINEFVTNSLKIAESLPVNVDEPVIETLPDGVLTSWVIHAFKPQMKLFITYYEKTNPLKIINELQITPRIFIKK